MKKNLVVVAIFASAMLLGSSAAYAQAPATATANKSITDQDIQLLRQDLRSQKKQLIAANLPLTDAEAVKFWPVYDQYTAELIKVNDGKYATIKEYAASYATMTDAQATSLIQRWLESDQSTAQLRLKYVPIVEKVLPGKKAAMFFQMDRRVALMIDMQLASEIPMVQP